jgi:sn-glycerol 3-phosphate transport system ATP-binding protein
MPLADPSPVGRPPGPSVRLAAIGKSFGPVTVLDGLHLSIQAGQLTVLLGGSGCGKTTCLRLIAGLESPTAGRIEIGGRDVTALPPSARGVGMVFQSYALFPHLNVAENIVFGLRARGTPKAEWRKRLAAAAELLGLSRLLDRKPSQLSGGQQQRVALGRAIVAEAPILLLDEPLSNLDAQLRAEMRQELVSLQRRLGLTMVCVTHDQAEAMTMADEVVVMRAGRIEQQAAPHAIYERPANEFVAGFIGAPPMNLMAMAELGAALAIAGGSAALAQARTAGIRPEDFIAGAARDDELGFVLAAETAEYVGGATVVMGRLSPGGPRVQARLPGLVTPAHAELIPLALPFAQLHLFGDDGVRISAASPAYA